MLHRLTLADLQRELESGRVSPREVVDDYLARIEAVNPKLNAFVTVYADQARQRAGERLSGPLAGIPVSIKDSFDVAGQPTYCGSRFRLAHRATANATCVARLEAAGAIVLGKTSTPEFLANYETDNHIVGRTNNPWNLDLTPGGSSGGEAAAIAGLCSAGGMGSDGGGSVRWPAHACGIAALKPTPGRVPATGHEPRIAHPGGLLGVAGPMARTARDLKMLFDVVAGYDDQDPFSVPVGKPSADLADLKIGWADRFEQVPVSADIAAAVRSAALACQRDLQLAIEPWSPDGLERSPNLWSFFFSELPAEFIRETIAGREAEAHWTGVELIGQLAGRPAPTARQVVLNLAARDAMRSNLLRQMREFGVLLWPVAGTVAFPHRDRRYAAADLTGSKDIGLFQAMMPLFPANLLGLPAVVIPWSRSAAGLPIGIQLIGRPWEEESLLELAIRLEEVRGPFALPELV